MIRFDTFTTAIFDQFQSTFSGPAAKMLGGVLIIVFGVDLGWLPVLGKGRSALVWSDPTTRVTFWFQDWRYLAMPACPHCGWRPDARALQELQRMHDFLRDAGLLDGRPGPDEAEP